MIDLPDVRQRDTWDCGPAAVTCVLRAYGWGKRDAAFAVADLGNPATGTDPFAIESRLQYLGFDSHVCHGMTVDDLRHHTRQGRPVLCPVTWGGEGHYVTVGEVSRGRVAYQCPTDGPCRDRFADWLAAWQDWHRAGATLHRFGVAVLKR